MRPILIITGVLGGGTALTFAAAALVAALFPTGNLIYNQQSVFFREAVPVQVDPGFGVDLPAAPPVPVPGAGIDAVGGSETGTDGG